MSNGIPAPLTAIYIYRAALFTYAHIPVCVCVCATFQRLKIVYKLPNFFFTIDIPPVIMNYTIFFNDDFEIIMKKMMRNY